MSPFCLSSIGVLVPEDLKNLRRAESSVDMVNVWFKKPNEQNIGHMEEIANVFGKSINSTNFNILVSCEF